MAAARIGIDLGGSKTEIIVLQDGQIVWQKREPTPSASYTCIITRLLDLVHQAWFVAPAASVGIGMPGAITDAGRVKNANTVCLNGQPFPYDIEQALTCSVRIMNDANCFTLSEAVDGAATGASMVFGVILGTGTGGGLVMDQKVHAGSNCIAGEWGHNALCQRAPVASKQPRLCYCGKNNCVETFLSGAGLQQSSEELLGEAIDGGELNRRLVAGEQKAGQLFALYAEQLAASLAVVVNILDPDVIVLGGGLSNLPGLAEKAMQYLPHYVFSDTVNTRIVANHHGDASGVRGAAWLWPDQEL